MKKLTIEKLKKIIEKVDEMKWDGEFYEVIPTPYESTDDEIHLEKEGEEYISSFDEIIEEYNNGNIEFYELKKMEI